MKPSSSGLRLRTWVRMLSLLVMAGIIRSPLLKAATNVPMLKLSITTDGIYQLALADLTSAGWSLVGVDPRTIKLYQQGEEVAIRIQGEEDGSFDADDTLLFYGQGIHNRYTDTNLYWLSVSEGLGKRMAQRNGTPVSALSPSPYFLHTLHAEEDTNYWQSMTDKGEDRWFWGKRLAVNSAGLSSAYTYTLATYHLVTDTTAVLRLRVKGYSGLGHRSQVYLNDHLLDDQQWQGQTQFTHVVSFPQSYLVTGDNQLRVEVAASQAPIDQILVNWIELDTWRYYQAQQDQLRFTSSLRGTQQFVIRGFSSPEVEMFDISDPAQPVQLGGTIVANQGTNYQLAVQDELTKNTRYVVSTPARYQRPLAIQLNQPTTWRSPANGADYIIITHEDFYASAIKLANLRAVSGLRTAVIDVTDLYDEFNGGVFAPQAIRDFLAYAYANWQLPAPRYVVLLGDANQDYKDHLQTDTPNYVPSQIMDSDLFGEVSSDAWFVAIHDNDPRPALAIGRLPAQTAAEAEAMVNKIIDYEHSSTAADWKNSLLFMADDDDPGFKSFAEQLIAQTPANLTKERIYADRYPPGDLTADLIAQFNRGSLFATYIGHGSFDTWGQWDGNSKIMFTTDSVMQLTNQNALPFVIVANCLNGFFTGPKAKPSLAETLLRYSNGGAIAVWAPSSLEYAAGHEVLLRNFYKSTFVDQESTIGAAISSAEFATYADNPLWQELILTYILFGDPATPIRLPVDFHSNLRYLPIVSKQ